VRSRAAAAQTAPAAQHDEYLSELKALRALIEPKTLQNREALEQARAQAAEVDAFRAELATIHGAIDSAHGPMAELEGAVLNESQLRRASRELEAIVSSTEQATQTVLRAAELIERAAAAIEAAADAIEHKRLAQEISGCAVQIFQACNFQDLTGQQANNV